jgi:uncharacterized protein YbaR (Trm112 family)
METDTRFTYGAMCSWRGPISKVQKTYNGLPCCPYCRGPLYEIDSIEKWTDQIEAFESSGHLGYTPFQQWLSNRQEQHGCLFQRNADDRNAILDLYVREGHVEPVGIRL